MSVTMHTTHNTCMIQRAKVSGTRIPVLSARHHHYYGEDLFLKNRLVFQRRRSNLESVFQYEQLWYTSYIWRTPRLLCRKEVHRQANIFFCLPHRKILASNRLSEEMDTVTKKSFKFCILKDRALEQHDYESDVLRYWCKPHAFALLC